MTIDNHPLSFTCKEVRPWPNRLFKRGTLVGHTTTRSTKIWLRAKKPGTYQIVLHTNKLNGASEHNGQWRDGDQQPFTPAVTLEINITENSQLNGVFDINPDKDPSIQALQPNTRYYYGIRMNSNWILGIDRQASFKTLAEDGPLRFAFYSCHMPYKTGLLSDKPFVSETIENWSNFRDVISRSPVDLLIGGGDQVYSDGDKSISIIEFLRKKKDEVMQESAQVRKQLMMSWYADIYQGYWGFEDMSHLFAHIPTYMTWDDHEIMDGWGSYEQDKLELVLKDGIFESGNERAENRQLMYEMYQAASESYYNFQHNHNPDTNIDAAMIQDPNTVSRRKWHYTFYAKGNAFFVMDTRGHKSLDRQDPNYEGQHTLLGRQQLADFEAFLQDNQTRQAKALFIISAVPFVHWKQYVMNLGEVMTIIGAQDDVRDEWDHSINQRERDQVLDLLFNFSTQNNKKVFILSGDVHCAASFKLEKPQSSARIFQITSSAISYAKNKPAWLVEKQVEETGCLNNSTIGFRRLTPVEVRNNFALLQVESDEDEVNVYLDLYGRAEREDGMLMFERLKM